MSIVIDSIVVCLSPYLSMPATRLPRVVDCLWRPTFTGLYGGTGGGGIWRHFLPIWRWVLSETNNGTSQTVRSSSNHRFTESALWCRAATCLYLSPPGDRWPRGKTDEAPLNHRVVFPWCVCARTYVCLCVRSGSNFVVTIIPITKQRSHELSQNASKY